MRWPANLLLAVTVIEGPTTLPVAAGVWRDSILATADADGSFTERTELGDSSEMDGSASLLDAAPARDQLEWISEELPRLHGSAQRLIERREQFPDGEYVFGPRPDGLHRVSRQLHEASGANCGPRINLNLIRHFFFAQWVALGGDAVSLAKIAGWSMARLLSFQVFTHRRTSESDKTIQEQIEKSISC